jgi:hypothetical protein
LQQSDAGFATRHESLDLLNSLWRKLGSSLPSLGFGQVLIAHLSASSRNFSLDVVRQAFVARRSSEMQDYAAYAGRYVSGTNILIFGVILRVRYVARVSIRHASSQCLSFSQG